MAAVFFILCIPVAACALDAQAVVDKSRIGLDDTVRLDVLVNGDEADVDVSVIKDFNIISRGTSSNVRIINTQVSRETTYQYVLLPLKEGQLTIPPLKVARGKETVYTRPIRIQVSQTGPRNLAERDIFVQAFVSKIEAVEGEQIIYTFRLYRTVQIDSARLQKPDFIGFSATEIEGNRSGESIISGRRYAVAEVSYVLIPLQSGKLEIGPAVLSCDVRHLGLRRSHSFFDDSFFNRGRWEKKVFRTEPLTVNVAPLPPHSSEVTFSGLVGEADFRAAIEDNEIAVGDSTTLTLTIEGSGNIMDAEEPEITLPDGFKIYRDAPEEDVKLGNDGYAGHKTFRIALVPVKEGDFTIPPIRFNYFDMAAKRYKTIASPAFSIRANPSQEKTQLEVFSADAIQNRPPVDRQDVKFTGRDILPLKEDLNALSHQQALSFGRFVFLALLPILLYLSAGWFLRFMRKTDDPARVMSRKAREALKDAGHPDISIEEFLSLLYKALITGICATAGASGQFAKGASLTHAEAEEILRNNGWADDSIQQAIELFKRIESARYSGWRVDSELRETLLADTRHMLRSLSS